MTKDAIQTGTERENEKQEGGEPRAQREAKHRSVFVGKQPHTYPAVWC